MQSAPSFPTGFAAILQGTSTAPQQLLSQYYWMRSHSVSSEKQIIPEGHGHRKHLPKPPVFQMGIQI